MPSCYQRGGDSARSHCCQPDDFGTIAIGRPGVRQRPPLHEQIIAPLRRLDLVANCPHQCHLMPQVASRHAKGNASTNTPTAEMTELQSQTAVPRHRWWIGVLLGSGILVNYFDRINLSIAAPQLQQEFALDAAQMGLLFSVFFWPYAVLQIPVGLVLDRFGVMPVGRLSASLWSVANGADRAGDGNGRHYRRANSARRRRGACLSGQCQGHRILVPAQRAQPGDRDLRFRRQILECDRRPSGRIVRR